MNRYVAGDGLARAHCLAAIAPGTLPTERLIFPAGEFVTTKGTFLFDDKAAAAVMADWEEWTGGLEQKGSSDYEHDQSKDNIPGHLKLDSSSYDLELRNGALWTVNIRWTELAAGMIERREKRFTSPWWLYEKATKRIVRYINFGLVSMPATIAQPELMAAAASVQVQVPEFFAGYASETAPAKQEPPPPAAAEPPPVAEPAAAATPPPEPTNTTPEGEKTTMTVDYKDPGFKPMMHGWDLRDMTSSALHNMQCAVRLHNEVPMLAAAMELPKHVAHLADHVAHCAAAMVHHMVGEADDMPEDVDASKLPAEVATKVKTAIELCKAAKVGGGKASRGATEAATALATAKAELATETAKRIAAEKAADQVKYNDLIEKNRTKITKGAQEDWVRANVLTSEALAAYLPTLKPVAVATTHQQGSGQAGTSAEDRKKVIEAIELPAQQLADWFALGANPDRLFNLQEAEAKRLGLVQ